jgi:acetyl-CoA/propionyl-CoA carboxylase biotin carboxyl carrier protein
MLRALREFRVEGVPTTVPAHLALLDHPEFVDGSYTTRTLGSGALDELAVADAAASGDGDQAVLLVGGSPVRLWNPGMAASAPHATARGSDASANGVVTSPMHGTILQIEVKPGDTVERGDPVAVLEAMKMETRVAAGRAGEVTAVHVSQGDVVEAGQPIAEIA